MSSSKEIIFGVAVLPCAVQGIRPIWSVMIPTYNCASYLRVALASVLEQDPGREIMQIAVVDDCSDRDDPERVVRELGGGRVEFYKQPRNVGHTANFATCLQRAQGRLIHQLHGDDCVRPGFYAAMQKAFEQRPEIGAAFCRHVFIDELGNPVSTSELERQESGILDGWLEKIATRQRIQTPAIVVKREVYDRLGGFDQRLSWVEDWEMWVRIAAHYPIWYEVEPLAMYRQHQASNTGKYVRTGENIRDARRAVAIINSYLPKDIAAKVRTRSLERWAWCSIHLYARDMIEANYPRAALIQLIEGLKCSHSLKTMKDVVYMLRFMGMRKLHLPRSGGDHR